MRVSREPKYASRATAEAHFGRVDTDNRREYQGFWDQLSFGNRSKEGVAVNGKKSIQSNDVRISTYGNQKLTIAGSSPSQAHWHLMGLF